eukprot:m.74220 g.74220  ORF g.74220 m.74220 type:complete len:292 (-) comp16157_c0_seq1:356-1231(-)
MCDNMPRRLLQTLGVIVILSKSAADEHLSAPRPDADWDGWKYSWRDDRFNMFLSHLQFHMIPNFTEVGFEKTRIPGDVLDVLNRSLQQGLQAHDSGQTLTSDSYVNILDSHGEGALFLNTQVDNYRILETLRPMHEEWAGVPLEKQFAFGIRIYRDGNILKKHVDRVESHVISSILHIDHDTNEPWPLTIQDNTGEPHEVLLEPGAMLFYESARLMHWRPGKLNGRYYASIFLHYRPVSWDLTASKLLQSLPVDWDVNTTTDPAARAMLPETPAENPLQPPRQPDAHGSEL